MDQKLFSDEWMEFLGYAHSMKLKYLLVGGIALALHGIPRSTQDIDVWIENSAPNIKRLKKVLIEFGFAELAEKLPTILSKREVIFLGKAPYRMDILSGISGVTFAKAYPKRLKHQEKELSIPFMGLQHLLENKKASGRLKDELDVELILKRMKSKS